MSDKLKQLEDMVGDLQKVSEHYIDRQSLLSVDTWDGALLDRITADQIRKDDMVALNSHMYQVVKVLGPTVYIAAGSYVALDRSMISLAFRHKPKLSHFFGESDS